MPSIARCGAAACAALVFAASSSAVTLRFGGTTNNDDKNTDTGEMQLTIDVFSPTTGPVREFETVVFRVLNTGSAASAVNTVLFDDFFVDETPARLAPVLDFVNNIENGPGVFFEQSFQGQPLPGDPNFTTDFGFEAGFIEGRATNPAGIDPGEFLDLEFALIPGMTFEDVVQALAADTLRIGLIAEFDVNGVIVEEAFVSDPSSIIPLPGGAALGLAGLGAIALRRRRF